MGLPLKDNIQRIRDDESRCRDNYGFALSIDNYDGTSACGICRYDSYYRRSTDPLCPSCMGSGFIPLVSSHEEQALIFWNTEAEIQELEAGGLKVGDCRVIARYESKPYFDNALRNKILLNVDGATMIIMSVQPTTLRTTVEVQLSRTEPR